MQRELLARTRRGTERLVDDARAAGMITHPNIATLFDVGEEEGRLYLAYEFVAGHDAASADGRPPDEPAPRAGAGRADRRCTRPTRTGVGVVHRDLRPDTIVETAKGSAKVLDFGMSAWTRGGRTRALAAAAPASLGRRR